MQPTKGLTLIEVIIALALLGVLVTAIVSPIVGSFQIARTNRLSLNATSEAQRIIEAIRGNWKSPSLYDSNCAPVVLAANQSVSLTPLTSEGTVATGTLTFSSSSCAAPTAPGVAICPISVSPMKRISVKVTDPNDTSRNLSTINLDVVCPRR